MFTGLIREIATVKHYANNILSIRSHHKAKIGESIAINGVCLTVIRVNNDGFDLELADETRTVIDENRLKGKVHMEPAMELGDRFDGHIVQGHIDCIGTLLRTTVRSNGVDFFIQVDPKHILHIVPKGSIAIDGVSLTVNEVYADSFRLTLIPQTLKETLIGSYKIGTKINIETDFFARYIDHILRHRSAKKQVSWEDIDAMHALF